MTKKFARAFLVAMLVLSLAVQVFASAAEPHNDGCECEECVKNLPHADDCKCNICLGIDPTWGGGATEG